MCDRKRHRKFDHIGQKHKGGEHKTEKTLLEKKQDKRRESRQEKIHRYSTPLFRAFFAVHQC